MKPRTVCFCQPIFSMISASVAPFFRWSMATTWAVLLPSRGPALSGAFAAFLGALVVFFAGIVFLGAAALAPLLALGAPFFWLAAFFEGAFSGATGAPCSATAAVSVVLVASAFFMVGVYPFGGWSAHDDSSLRSPRKARRKFNVSEESFGGDPHVQRACGNMGWKLAARRDKRGKSPRPPLSALFALTAQGMNTPGGSY